VWKRLTGVGVAKREHEIELRGIRRRELLPGLWMQAGGRVAGELEDIQDKGSTSVAGWSPAL
jgi:hypothetical protein